MISADDSCAQHAKIDTEHRCSTPSTLSRQPSLYGIDNVNTPEARLNLPRSGCWRIVNLSPVFEVGQQEQSTSPREKAYDSLLNSSTFDDGAKPRNCVVDDRCVKSIASISDPSCLDFSQCCLICVFSYLPRLNDTQRQGKLIAVDAQPRLVGNLSETGP